MTSVLRKRPARKLQVIIYGILIIGCLFTLGPFIWTILASFKTHAEITNPRYHTFLPENFTLENYRTILTDESLPLARF